MALTSITTVDYWLFNISFLEKTILLFVLACEFFSKSFGEIHF